jgi:hypothetical protein
MGLDAVLWVNLFLGISFSLLPENVICYSLHLESVGDGLEETA